MDLDSIRGAAIDWRMAEGETITIGVIPAGYFENLNTVLADFKTLTGVDARLDFDALIVAAEVIVARSAPDGLEITTPVGGYVTVGARVPGPDLQVLLRLDSYSPDGPGALDHELLLAANVKPTPPVELQLNWTAPLEGGFGDHRCHVCRFTALNVAENQSSTGESRSARVR